MFDMVSPLLLPWVILINKMGHSSISGKMAVLSRDVPGQKLLPPNSWVSREVLEQLCKPLNCSFANFICYFFLPQTKSDEFRIHPT